MVFPLRVLQACEGGERERDAAVGGVLQLHLEHVLAVVRDFGLLEKPAKLKSRVKIRQKKLVVLIAFKVSKCVGRQLSTEVASVTLTQLFWVRFSVFPRNNVAKIHRRYCAA